MPLRFNERAKSRLTGARTKGEHDSSKSYFGLQIGKGIVMRKPRKGTSYVMVSDGDLRSLWEAKPVAIEAFARRVIMYAQVALADISPQLWESPRQPKAGTSFLLVGTPEREQVWTGLSKDQSRSLFRWAYDEFRRPLTSASVGGGSPASVAVLG